MDEVSLAELQAYYAKKKGSMEPAKFEELMANSLQKAKVSRACLHAWWLG
jgi:hypothetical protein